MAVPDVALTPAAATSPEDSPALVMTDMTETAQHATVSRRKLYAFCVRSDRRIGALSLFIYTTGTTLTVVCCEFVKQCFTTYYKQ